MESADCVHNSGIYRRCARHNTRFWSPLEVLEQARGNRSVTSTAFCCFRLLKADIAISFRGILLVTHRRNVGPYLPRSGYEAYLPPPSPNYAFDADLLPWGAQQVPSVLSDLPPLTRSLSSRSRGSAARIPDSPSIEPDRTVVDTGLPDFPRVPMLVNQQRPRQRVGVISYNYNDPKFDVYQILHDVVPAEGGGYAVETSGHALEDGEFKQHGPTVVRPLDSDTFDNTTRKMLLGELRFPVLNITEKQLVYGTVEQLKWHKIVEHRPEDGTVVLSDEDYLREIGKFDEVIADKAPLEVSLSFEDNGTYRIIKETADEAMSEATLRNDLSVGRGRTTPRFRKLVEEPDVGDWNRRLEEALAEEVARREAEAVGPSDPELDASELDALERGLHVSSVLSDFSPLTRSLSSRSLGSAAHIPDSPSIEPDRTVVDTGLPDFPRVPMLVNQQRPRQRVGVISYNYNDPKFDVYQILHDVVPAEGGGYAVETSGHALEDGEFKQHGPTVVRPLDSDTFDNTTRKMLLGELRFPVLNITEKQLVYGTVEQLKWHKIVEHRPEDGTVVLSDEDYLREIGKFDEVIADKAPLEVSLSFEDNGTYRIIKETADEAMSEATLRNDLSVGRGRTTPRFRKLVEEPDVGDWNRRLEEALAEEVARREAEAVGPRDPELDALGVHAEQSEAVQPGFGTEQLRRRRYARLGRTVSQLIRTVRTMRNPARAE